MIKGLLTGIILICGACYSPAAAQETVPAKELVQYVHDAKKAGLTDNQVQQNAEKAGWPAPIVAAAIAQEQTPTKKAAEVIETPPAAPVEPLAAGTPAATPQPISTGTGVPAAAAPETAKAGSKIPTVNRGVSDEYQIGGGDVLSINVWGEPAASVPGVVVRPDGKISMPLVKEVSVAGLTPTQLEKVITEQLSDKLKAADVTVVVNQVNSKKIFLVGGGVKKEGPLAYSYRMTVMQAISEAGGLTDYAKRKKIYVLRNEDGRQFKLPFDYDAVLNGEHMEVNIQLVPGDIIVVPNH
jgi:polysaccharide export outer membrane protein